MKIGISRPSSSPEAAQEVFSCAAHYGFAGVQLKPAQYEPYLGAPEAFLGAYGKLAALARGGLIVYPGGKPEAWPDRVRKVMPFAHAVGAGHICVCACVYASGGSAEEVRAVATTLEAIGREARQEGLAISIHNHVKSIVETDKDILTLLEQLDPALCGLTYDTAHAAKAGVTDLTGLLEKVRPHLLNVHLKDLNEEGQFCPLGRGRLNLPPVIQKLREIDYQEWLIVDEESAAYSTPEAMSISREFLDTAFDELSRHTGL